MTVITKTFSFSRADSTGKAGQFVRPFLLLPCRYIFCHDINVDILTLMFGQPEWLRLKLCPCRSDMNNVSFSTLSNTLTPNDSTISGNVFRLF